MRRQLLTQGFLLLVGLLAGILIGRYGLGISVARAVPLRDADPRYPLVNPLLSCSSPDEPGDVPIGPYKILKANIVEHIQNAYRDKTAQSISVYFRDLVTGNGFRLNETELYDPASLLKVPVLMSFYKKSEGEPKLFESRLLYDGSFDENAGETYKSTLALVPGTTYSIKDLLSRMIKYSDNNALHLLIGNIDPRLVQKVSADIHAPLPEASNADTYTLSIETYSYFFRVLYNATYLWKSHSEEVLQLLTESDFAAGIRADLPRGLLVADKFGERTYPDLVKASELHDCGIVYYPGRPYLLCAMTRGDQLPELAHNIQDVSRSVYESISKVPMGK